MEIGYLVTVLGVIFVSMTIHEAMHGFIAYYLGDDTAKQEGRLTLNPLKHIDPFLTILLPVMLVILGGPIFGGAKPVPFNPSRVRYGEWGAALVAVSGPLVNLVLAFVSFGLMVVLGSEVSSTIGMILQTSVFVNLGFFVFNMIPFPPLDGSRLLYAVAPDGVRRVMAGIEQFGILGVFAIILLAQGQIGTFMVSAIGTIIDIFDAIFSVF